MRNYAMAVTAALTAFVTAEGMFAFSRADVIEIGFAAIMCGCIAAAVFVVITEPKKRKAHWEKAGGLEVMIMGGRK